MKILIPLLIVGMALSGCATTAPLPEKVIVIQHEVVMPDHSLLHCTYSKLPDSFKDNKEVAKELVQLYSEEHICANKVKSINDYLTKAAKDTQQP